MDWLTNRFDLSASFPRDSAVPNFASVTANSIRFPAHLFRLDPYQTLTASIDARWESNRFSIGINGGAAAPATTKLPAIELDARASGDTNRAQIEALHLSAPGLDAGLSKPVDFHFPRLSSRHRRSSK